MADTGTLTPSQKRAIAALLTERDTRAAAVKAGVKERSLYRWLTLPDFKAELQEAEKRSIDAAIRRLAELTAQAVDTLREVMTDKEENGEQGETNRRPVDAPACFAPVRAWGNPLTVWRI